MSSTEFLSKICCEKEGEENHVVPKSTKRKKTMKEYQIYTKKNTDAGNDYVESVRIGRFNWWAAIFPFWWSILSSCYGATVAAVCINIVFMVSDKISLGDTSGGVTGAFLFIIWLIQFYVYGSKANSWKVASLLARGYVQGDSVSAKSHKIAKARHRYFIKEAAFLAKARPITSPS